MEPHVKKEESELNDCSDLNPIKKVKPYPVIEEIKMEAIDVKPEDKSRMLFEKFLSVCKDGQKSWEMEEILRKTDGYYKNTKPEYIRSQEFQTLVTRKTEEIIKNPRRIYVFIKDVVDEMRSRKQKHANLLEKPPNKKQKLTDNASGEEAEGAGKSTKEEVEKEEEGEKLDEKVSADLKYTERRVRKLSRALKRIDAVIKKLEEKEVDFDEDNDSSYIKLERYKDRFCKVHQKLCELTGDKISSKLARRIDFSGTDSQEINRCIEKFVNKTGNFPDFHDILNLVKNVESGKNMTPKVLRRIAEKAFLSVGRQLQKKRQYESWDSVSVFLKNETDPADQDPELESTLRKNSEENSNRIQMVIDSFAEKQIKDNLKAEEVPDEVANKSEESGQDETEEGEDEEEENEETEEEKDYVDKILRGDDSTCLDVSVDVEMDQEDEDSNLSDEDEMRDLGTSDEKDSIYSDNRVTSSSCLEDDDSESINKKLSLKEYNLIPIKRNLGPVSPPVLGEVLTDRDMISPSTFQNYSTPHKTSAVSDTNLCKGKNNDDLSESGSESLLKQSVPTDLEKIDQPEKESQVLGCSKDVSNSGKHSDMLGDNGNSENLENSKASELSSSQEVSVIIETKSSSEKLVKNGCQPSDVLTMKPGASASSVTILENRDSVSPSLLEPTIETTKTGGNSKTNIGSYRRKSDKFIVTKIEMESLNRECSSVRNIMKQKVKQEPGFSRVVTSKKISSECVDVITLE